MHVFDMQVCPGNECGLAKPRKPRPAIHTLYYLDTGADTCMKTKIMLIYCNTLYYTYINTLYYDA